jgi:4-amino-4-deoxy-L-arabinose transferase-like glycosyltransferase
MPQISSRCPLSDAILQPPSLNTSRNYFLLFLACVVFHLIGTWNLPLIDRDEPRFAEASREMRARADWIIPYFNGQYRFDKPPLTYWAQVASYRIFGESDFTARFPSAVAAGLTAVVVLAWGTKIGTRRTGWWAAVIFSLSLQTFLHAKAAVADMWLVLFMTTAHWAGYCWLVRPVEQTLPSARTPAGWWWLAFFASLALAFLAKGPVGLLPLIPAAWMLWKIPTPANWVRLACGLFLTGVIICLWAVPALIQTHGEFFRIGIGRHVVGRSVGAMEGHGAKSAGLYLLFLPFYLVAVFLSFFPWSYKLQWLFRQVRSHRDLVDGYLLSGIVVIFGVFTLVATKLPHYTLPAFPLLSLLLARRWSQEAAEAGKGPSLFHRVALVTAVLWIAAALVLPPLTAKYFPSYALFSKSRDYLRPEMQFASVNFAEPSLVWYFRSKLKPYLTPIRRGKAAEFMSESGPRMIVLPTQTATVVFPNVPQEWKRIETRGLNIPKGQRVDLTLLLKE